MAGHGHSHGCGHEHDHDDISDAERGVQYSLYLKINTETLQCLNESEEGSAKNAFKPWDKRLEFDKFVESDCDEELLFNIPFTGNVKLKGIIIIGGEDGQHPSQMKLYKNRPNMSFDDTGAEPDQVFDVQVDRTGVIEYPAKVTRFNQVSHLSIYFPTNFGAETTKVYYIGLRGDYMEAQRSEVIITTYEARANPADHKSNAFDSVGHQIH